MELIVRSAEIVTPSKMNSTPKETFIEMQSLVHCILGHPALESQTAKKGKYV